MFKNLKGELVPHCVDCIHCADDSCPANAIADEIDDERGVIDCPGFEKKL